MDSDGRGLGRDQVDVGEFPSSNSPSWRLWLLDFLSTADQLKWNYQKCCQKISESLVAAVFNAFLEAKLSVEVEIGDPSVIDVLSRTLAVIGFTQMENLEETFLHQTQQRADENIFVYARRVGAIKTLALKERGNEYSVAICASGLTDKCLRDVAEQPGIAASIGRELEPQDSFVSQLDVLWSKMHQVRLFDAEAQAHEEELTTDQERSRVVQGDERFQTFRLLTKEKQTRSVADVDSSNAAQRKNEETKSESIAHTNAARVTRSTSAWKASYWGGEDSDDDCDDLVGDHEGSAHKQHQRTELWSYSSDEESPDEENDELWSELYSDDDYDFPYELVTLEEALRQFDESKKARLASGNHASLTAPEEGYKLVPTPETLMWDNEPAERSSVFEVRSGEAIVQCVWVKYDVETNVQMNHINRPERGLIEIAVVRLINKAVTVDFEQMSAERTTLSIERCSFTLETRMELSQRTDETWEVESGHCTTQAVECNFKAIEELADLKLECVKQGNLDCMCAPKTEAERPWHGIQTFVVEAEPQWDPRPTTEVARTAYQRVPERNAGIKLTEASSARRKRKVWTSFLWFMTALWVQVNVLSDCGKSLPLKVLPRCPNGWDNALWPPYVNWGRAASLLCEEDWVQHRQCLFPVCRWEATKWKEGKVCHSFEQSDRSWIRHKRNPGAELMRLNSDSGDAKMSVPIVDMENNHTEVNEKLAEVSRVNPRGQFLEGKPLSTPSRMMFIKLSRICPKHPCHETKMTSVPDGGDTGQAMRKAMLTPEGKWFCHPPAPSEPQKTPVPRCVSDSGQCDAGVEQKRNVAVPSADSCSWISHRKHGRWKAEEHAAQILDEKMTYRVTTRYHDAFPKDCEMSNENW